VCVCVCVWGERALVEQQITRARKKVKRIPETRMRHERTIIVPGAAAREGNTRGSHGEEPSSRESAGPRAPLS
jgi:hypothetical protein